MLNSKGFNLWAGDYDKTVQVSEENNQYPFAGYKEILDTIFNEVMQKENSRILDIGFGTGILTSKLYENNHQIVGIDFASEMIAIAQNKMPEANLIEWDITNGLPSELTGDKYDSIISTYTLHHLNESEKTIFIVNLLNYLKENGRIFIGDISFETMEKLEKCRKENIEYWDNDEFYFVYDELCPWLKAKCNFYPISHCGGVFIIENNLV